MNIKIYENRNVKRVDTDVFGTQNENKVTELKIEVPEQYKSWNKRIVFITDEGNPWYYIENDTFTLENDITKYEEVEAYIWLTEKAEAEQESVGDFRSEIFTLSFFANINADDIVPDEKQIDGFNTILTTLNAEIEEVKQINTDFTKLKQDVEEAEAERNKKVDNAVNTIKDLKEGYNENAKKKIKEYNDNADDKKKVLDDHTEENKKDINDYVTGQETSLKKDLDEHKKTLEKEMSDTKDSLMKDMSNVQKNFNDNAQTKTTDFNNNALDKLKEYNDNADELIAMNGYIMNRLIELNGEEV